MRFFTFLSLFSLWLFVPAFSQVSGKIQDQEHQPIPFANVLLLTPQDSSLVQGMISNEAGEFVFPSPTQGEYLLAVSMVGYQSVYTPLHVSSGAALDMEIIRLAEEVQELGEVVVRAQKPLYEQQMDKLVVNVQNSITSAGGSALDILERSPGVTVNRQNGQIALNGKDNVAVMINGKLSRMSASALTEMLQGMNGSTIATIELMANPPARYDAEGTGGLINIVMKKQTEMGTHGSVNLSTGYGYGEKNGASLTFNHRREKLNLFGDYSFTRNRTHQVFQLSHTFEGENGPISSNTESERWPVVTNHTARAGFDLELAPRTMLGSLVSAYTNLWDMEAFNQTNFDTPNGGTLIETDNTEKNHWKHGMANLNLTHTFAQGQEIRFDLDYLVYQNDNPSAYFDQQLGEGDEVVAQQQAQMQKITPIRMGVAKVDYRQNLGENLQWEVGVKGAASRFTNDVSFELEQEDEPISVPELTQKHRLTENVLAAYTSLQWQFQSQTRIVAGLRYEHTDTELNSETEQGIVDRKYGNLFPNLLLSHDFNAHQNLQFTYGRRITRPTFNDLAPFVIFLGSNNLVSGNAALQPALSHTLKVQHRWKSLISALEYSHTSNSIARFQPHFNAESHELHFFAENLKSHEAVTLTVVLPWHPTSWWSMQNTLTSTYAQLVADYLETPEEKSNLNVGLNSTQSFLLPYGLSLEITANYLSSALSGLYREKAVGAVNVGLQKKLKNPGESLRLTWDDLFWTTPWRFDYSLSERNFRGDAVFRMTEPRVVRLTYSRSFGNQKAKAERQHKTASDEERRRVN